MEQIGTIFVDAGIVMVGDPCYSLPDDASHRDAVARDWSRFCDATQADPNNADGFSTPLGEGTSIVVSSGYGDGQYPVFVERTYDGRVARLVIEFVADEQDEDEEEECRYCSNPAEYDGQCTDCRDDCGDCHNNEEVN
jgi:hypothetical protein